MFAYKITIENKNRFPVKLLKRHWHIYDSNGSVREVEETALWEFSQLIAPSSSYQYISGCNLSLKSEDEGTYLLENINNKK